MASVNKVGRPGAAGKARVPTFCTSDLAEIFGKDRSTIRRWWRAGKLPKPKISGEGVFCRWLVSDIVAWIEARDDEGDA